MPCCKKVMCRSAEQLQPAHNRTGSSSQAITGQEWDGCTSVLFPVLCSSYHTWVHAWLGSTDRQTQTYSWVSVQWLSEGRASTSTVVDRFRKISSLGFLPVSLQGLEKKPLCRSQTHDTTLQSSGHRRPV